MTELVRRYRVPVNKLLRPAEVDFLPRMLRAIERELYRRELFWQQSVGTLVEGLVLRLGRQANEQERVDVTPGDLAHAEALRTVRMQVHELLDERWTVASMAQLTHLSPSRFAVLYQRLFGLSPIDDLIETRLARARILLANATMSVSEAAAQTGFRSIYYFSRLFHRRVGCAPRDYYRRHLRQTENAEVTDRETSADVVAGAR
jgi:AraC-like DNA-binding protein